MKYETHIPALTGEQKQHAAAILSAGCDRETVAKYLNCLLGDIQREMSQDPQFAAEVRRAEASSELNHMRNVQRAAQDEKQWRASVWWLERRAPERFGRRDAGAVTPRQLEQVISHLISLVLEEIHDREDLERVVVRLQDAARSLQELCRDTLLSANRSNDSKLLTQEKLDDGDGNLTEEDELPCDDD
jgi:hypothetical protein